MFLLEGLVLGICLQGKGGCSESTSAYYKHNRELQQVVKSAEEYGQKTILNNEVIVYAVTPLYAIAAGRPMQFVIHRGFILKVDTKEKLLAIQWSY